MNSLYCRPSASRRPTGAWRRKSDSPSRSSSAMWSSLADRVRPTAAHHPSVPTGAALAARTPSANLVVITDGVECLAFRIVGSALKQLRVEDLFFDVGVHV